MFIKTIRIKNFRCFGEGDDGKGTEIDLNDGLTAFIGRNGSGKTSVLEALNFLIGQDYLPTKISEKDFHSAANSIKDEIVIEAETRDPFFFEMDVITDQKNQPATVIIPCKAVRLTIKRREKAERVLDDPFIINKMVIPFKGSIEEKVYQDKNFDRSYKIISLEETDNANYDLDGAKSIIKDLSMGRAVDLHQTEKYCTVQFKLKGNKDIRVASFPLYSLNFNPNKIKGLAKAYYLTKDRKDDVSGGYSLIAKILTDLSWKYKRNNVKRDTNGAIKGKYEDLAVILRNSVDDKNILIGKINDQIKKICCDDKNFQIDFLDIDQPYKSAFVAKREGEKTLYPNHLGSGFNILIAYALFAFVAEQEKIPVVLIIDEPELHLHSDWQRKMYEVFTQETNLQFIISTHSENFISLKHWQQIRFVADYNIFPKQKKDSALIQADGGGSGTLYDYLNDYANRNLHISLILKENLELFFARKCILVEGPAEKYALPKLLSFSGCNMEDYSVSIIPVWGKTKIKVYQMICKCFNIDYYTIFDHDDKDGCEPEKENGLIERNAQNEKMTKFNTSFEQTLGISSDNKFQKLVEYIDKLDNSDSLNPEIEDCLNKLKNFIEN